MLAPDGTEQRKGWRVQFKNAVRMLIALSREDGGEVALAALDDAERTLSQRAKGPDPERLAAGAHLDIIYHNVCDGGRNVDAVARLEDLGYYGRQVLTYGSSLALEPGILSHHARTLARLFAEQNSPEDESFWLDTLRGLLEVQWRGERDAKVAHQLMTLYGEMADKCDDAREELALVKAHLGLSHELRYLGLIDISDKRRARLYSRAGECAERADSPLDVVIGCLAIVDGE